MVQVQLPAFGCCDEEGRGACSFHANPVHWVACAEGIGGHAHGLARLGPGVIVEIAAEPTDAQSSVALPQQGFRSRRFARAKRFVAQGKVAHAARESAEVVEVVDEGVAATA